MDDPQRDLMDAEEAARFLDVGIRVVYRQAKLYEETHGREGIPARKIGKEWRFSRRALDLHVGRLSEQSDRD